MTNLFSVMLLCKEFSALLIAAQGKIVNIGSIAAMVPYAKIRFFGCSGTYGHS